MGLSIASACSGAVRHSDSDKVNTCCVDGIDPGLRTCIESVFKLAGCTKSYRLACFKERTDSFSLGSSR